MCESLAAALNGLGFIFGILCFLVFCDIGLRMGEHGGAFGELRKLREEYEHNPYEFKRRYTRQYREEWGFREEEE